MVLPAAIGLPAGAESERAILADRETGSVDGVRLRRSVVLELVVGGNVSSTALVILEDTALEGAQESLGLLALGLA